MTVIRGRVQTQGIGLQTHTFEKPSPTNMKRDEPLYLKTAHTWYIIYQISDRADVSEMASAMSLAQTVGKGIMALEAKAGIRQDDVQSGIGKAGEMLCTCDHLGTAHASITI